MKKRVKLRTHYPEALKRKIAKEYLSGAASYGVLAEENGLKNKDVVKEFVRWYRRKLASEPSVEILMCLPENQPSVKTVDQREKELIELRKELELTKLKNEMLETMIDVAEEELNIEIRKKSGTNQ